MGVPVGEQVEARGVEKVENVGPVAGGVLELRLEAVAEEEDEPCLAHRRGVDGGELEVVRLRARRRQILDRVARCDLLRRERERIEARNHAVRPGLHGRPTCG